MSNVDFESVILSVIDIVKVPISNDQMEKLDELFCEIYEQAYNDGWDEAASSAYDEGYADALHEESDDTTD